ncbi:hypothetical protein E3Q22_02250 [Wallemia mellicola]|uniref:DASH complex subunit DAD4 n=2 Tax=Wallemia mellicola TaxID=1708541 RepID=A0A4T0TUI8_9BASI|nr:DASH complex, subunit Dad4 [Wallemia mellicola CBS 633.66]TIB72779.1 hypothetical protein E3Q24_01473 [Wallemia mellicola]EIM20242.1 DASH complex, subunit Dad4 [Wallemia mellicola CBS 633.66]TIB77530.1 hypothetical protein E3Q23_01258 [Wallemia mellicola]TIB79882.1 hypothetical protein E3Q22_02250 [Wallemia mellicola]TIB86874.1 hypothetical protein E3Q21_01512 [Wallemia mellicola]|eukprot:XP_006959730.1 DASH complex, subunit Dad4 [Wallemia mellicola CBS 633.66]
MSNPFEERQTVLLERIIKNVERCNEAFTELNKCVEDVNTANKDTVITSKLFDNYNRNVNYNLKAIGEFKQPL